MKKRLSQVSCCLLALALIGMLTGCPPCHRPGPDPGVGEGEGEVIPGEGESEGEGEVIPGEGEGEDLTPMKPLSVYDMTLSSGLAAEDLDECSRFRSDTAIKIGTDGVIHLAYQIRQGEYGDGYLACADNAGGNWRKFDGPWMAKTFGTYTSLALDDANHAHVITTGNGTGENATYITDKSGSWTSKVIDSSYSCALENSIVIDSQGSIHAAYWEWNGDYLRYATNASGSWQSYQMLENVAWGPTSILALNNGQLMIVYFNHDGYQCLIGSDPQAAWANEMIDPSGNNLFGSAAAKGADGSIFVASAGGLFTRTGSGWIKEAIFAGLSTKLFYYLDEDGLAIDSQNIKHICLLGAGSYADRIAKVIYLTNYSGLWQSAELDSFPVDAGVNYDFPDNPPAITVDGQDAVHLAYARNGRLVHCTFTPEQLLGK